MNYNAVISGLGGQGILSIAKMIAVAALQNNFYVKQSETHGMSQRGGSVSANVRISDHRINSGLIAVGTVDMILSMEPLESLRYVENLSPEGILITTTEILNNMPDYLSSNEIYTKIQTLPNYKLVNTTDLIKQTKIVNKTVNTLLLGVASNYLPINVELIKKVLEYIFSSKEKDTFLEANLYAFELGRGMEFKGEI